MGKRPKLRVETRPIGSLKPNPRNSRKHPQKQIDVFAGAVQTYGATRPILIDETGMILHGEGLWLASRQAGLEDVDVVVARGWSEQQKRAYVIADNRISELGEWDQGVLDEELAKLAAEGVDLGTLGFGADEEEAEAAALTVREIATTKVEDEFWISVRGPLKHQAAMLKALDAAAAPLADVQVELDTIQGRD